eukprot:INCI6097.2.p1 GENE.INCI6097.2~~INCI6097.2.p1  ORF type:complete len:463 (+),score=53.84 INCI6097.2:337-1725(+)
MSFEELDKDNMPGYYNRSQASWGGFPIENGEGGYDLVHAQMANGCPLGSWKTNSIVGLSHSTTGNVEGPYEFAETILPHFAHNPTIRRAPNGTYVVFFIGSWETEAKECALPTNDVAVRVESGGSDDACVANTTFDDPSKVREGQDYATFTLPMNATTKDCAASCCSDEKCHAWSYNTFADQAPICKHKNAGSKMVPNHCPIIRGEPNCLSGARTMPQTCNGGDWPKSCGPDMPGPMNDTCGPDDSSYSGNGGCGIAMATSESLTGPWRVQPLHIVDQFNSDEVYCAHTNPSAVFDEAGGVTLAFNAGFCHDTLETIGLASAPHWTGPYTLLDSEAILRNDDGTPHRCEDPHLWKSERGWHLLVHNQQGPQQEAAYAFSLDAKTWTLSPVAPYDCTLNFTDGTSAVASGCGNRPQLVFSESAAAGGPPLWLVNGATAAKPGGGAGTWTLFRKVSRSSRVQHD